MHNGILFSHENVIYNNMDKAWENSAKWNIFKFNTRVKSNECFKPVFNV